MDKQEHVVVAWAENASGPGWANRLVWVLLRDGNGKLRLEDIQREEMSYRMSVLLDVNSASTQAMTTAVTKLERYGNL